jgi:CheY-like chemotaxis protein
MIAAHGRGRLTVRTSSQPHGALLGGPALRVEVEDDGPGIPEETKRRIFEPFFTTKEVGKGTGLGLSLAHSIIGQHGGAIWAEDSPGGGARFVLELPVVAVPGPGAQPPSGAPGGPVALAGLRVLVADDEESLRDIAREVLEAEGCIVVEATDGRNALEQLERERFDLIVTDVKMPGLGGLDVYRQACERRPALRGRFLFVTGDWVSEDTARFFEETGCTHLEKPYNVDQLVEKARQVLAGSPSSS